MFLSPERTGLDEDGEKTDAWAEREMDDTWIEVHYHHRTVNDGLWRVF